MRSSHWLKYLFGHRAAILELAKWRGAIWAGVALVLLTGIARNYDQTFITENPVMWLFGSLLFSFVSGSWLYIVLYGFFARREMAKADGMAPAFWSGWRLFMGLFWLTAPIAWLYAIPVERFFDSVAATKLNVTLLGVVSLWRVLLMTRVMQVVTSAPFAMALVWVIFAAAIEVCVTFFFGGGFAKAIMSAMGGMRNSPEEEILYSTMSRVFTVAFWTVPVALVAGLSWRAKRQLSAFPESHSGPMPWRTLVLLAVFWVAVAIVPQRELAHSVAVERLIAEGKGRAALEYLASHQPADFAPARMLPPQPYEHGFFEQLPACFAAVQPTDPVWVRQHLMRRLDEMCSHYGPRSGRRKESEPYPREEQVKHVADCLGWLGPDSTGLLELLGGLERIPEGREWLKTDSVFLEGVREAAKETPMPYGLKTRTEAEQKSDWLTISNRLHLLATTNRNPENAAPR